MLHFRMRNILKLTQNSLVVFIPYLLTYRCTFTEVIAKLKPGYRFFGPPGRLMSGD